MRGIGSRYRFIPFNPTKPPTRPVYIIEKEMIYTESLKAPIILSKLKRIDPLK